MTGSPVNATLDDRELLRRYHEVGDASAREALVQRHLPLVRSLARRYAGRGEALDDIEQVGATGLLQALARSGRARRARARRGPAAPPEAARRSTTASRSARSA